MANAEDVAVNAGVTITISLLYAIISFGILIAVFWAINQAPFVSVDIGLFLDEYAVPMVIGLVVINLSNRVMALIEALRR